MTHTKRYSEITRTALESAGWFPGRALPEQVRAWREVLDKPAGFQMFEAAEKILSEFGGLRVRVSGHGAESAFTSFDVDPTLAIGEEDHFGACALELGVRLYPLGEVGDGAAFLAVAEDGRVFMLMDVAVAVVSSFDDAIAALIDGGNWRAMR